MKKILIFSITYFPFVGGAEVALREITDRLSPSEYEFFMITLRFDSKLPRYEKVGAIHVYRIGFGRRGATIQDTFRLPLSFNKYLYAFLACVHGLWLNYKYHFDLLWSMQANYAGFASLFTKFILRKVPFLLTLQEGDPISHYTKRVGIFYCVYQTIFRYANYIQTISTYLAEFARGMGYTGPVAVIPNGVDIKNFTHPHDWISKRDTVLKNARKPSGVTWLVTTSRLVVKNAVDVVIRSLVYLPKEVQFIVLGDGPDRATLEILARTQGVNDRVHFIGHVAHGVMQEYLWAADIFIRPSRSEGMGNSFIEAMAARLPVIATQVGGIPDFLYDPRISEVPTGLFCDVDSPKSVAEQIQLLMTDKKLRDRIVDNAYTMVSTQYDWETIVRNMRNKVFDTLL